MGDFIFSERSLNNLAGVHPDLQAVTRRALELTEVDFTVIDGRRTKAEQREMVRKGASRTMNSRHLTGHAIDFMALDANGKGTWDWPYYVQVAEAFKQAADELGIPIVWGGDWPSLRDGPHIELERHAYPADGDVREPRPLRETSTGKTGAAGIAATASAGLAMAAENADSVLGAVTNPALRAVVEVLPWAASALSVIAVMAVVLLMVRKVRTERER